MAKHNRTFQNEDPYFEYNAWAKYQNEHAKSEDFDTSKSAINAEHKRTGKDKELIRQERLQRYNDLRDEFNEQFKAKKAESEQIVIIRNNQLDSACSVFQKADRILTGKPVTIYLNDEQSDCPAFNDGKAITFNVRNIPAITEDTVLSLHGLNYHELAHLLYTPRAGSDLGKWIQETKITKHVNRWSYMDNGEEKWHEYTNEVEGLVEPLRGTAYNILEDCRIETILSAKYPSVRPFLTALLAEYIAKTADQLAENFMLLAGRRYFSHDLRQLSAQAMTAKHGVEMTREIYRITSAYRKLVFPRDYDTAKELINDLIKLLPKISENSKLPEGPNGCGSRPVMRNGKVESEKAQGELQDKDQDTEDKLPSEWGTEADNDSAKAEDTAKDFNNLKQEIANKLEEVIATAKSDPELQRKVKDTSLAITRDTSNKSILGQAQFQKGEATSGDVTATRLFAQELERIRIDSDPAWELERPTGKLNVRRAMNADVNEIGKLFDRWTTGNDDHNVEACILIDRSGSMYGEIGSACRSAWIIKRAIERINGAVSVMTFSTIGRTLYSRDQKAGPQPLFVSADGGTDPYYALLETERIMNQSQAKTKLLFLLTDGQFNSDNDNIIERLQKNGVGVSVAFLAHEHYVAQIMANPARLEEYRHKADNFRVITSPLDLIKIAKDVVKQSIKGVRV